MKKILAVLLTIAMLLPSLTTVLAASVEQASVSSVLTNKKAKTEPIGEERNSEFTPTKDVAELFGFSLYYDDGSDDDWCGFIRLNSNTPETVEFINGYYGYSFNAGDYIPRAQSIFAVKKTPSGTFEFTRIDANTFKETKLKDYGNFAFNDMAYDIASEVMYGITGNILYTVDLATGEYTMIGGTETTGNLFTLACSDAGVLYTVDENGNLFTLNKTTASATLIGNTGIGLRYTQSMTWDHINGGLYWANCSGSDGILYSLDTATGAATALGNIYGRNMEVSCLFTKGIYIGDPIPVTGVTLTPATATLRLGKTISLTAQVDPWDATDRAVTWASSNPDVATVDQNGLVTAIAYGEATITVTTVEGAFTAGSVITVPNSAEIEAAFNAALNAPGSDYHFTDDSVYPWDVVTFGERTAVKSTNSLVGDSHAAVTLPTINMYRGNTISFDWRTSCEYNYDKFLFKVNGETIAMITGENAEFAHYVYSIPTTGSYEFSWSYEKDRSGNGGEDASYLDNIFIDATPPGPVTGVTLTPAAVEMYQLETIQLTAIVSPSSALDLSVLFTSSDPAVATVSETGLVTALTEGTAIITATTNDGGHTALSTINVLSTVEFMRGVNAALNVADGTLFFGMDRVNPWVTDEATFPGRTTAHSTTSGIGDTQTTITLISNVTENQIISFDWMVSSEGDFDGGIFAIDGVEVLGITGTTMTALISSSFSAGAPGMHTYTWTYAKDASGNQGADMLWLDNVKFETAPEPEGVDIPATSRVHTGQTIKLDATVIPFYATDLSLTYTSSDPSKLTVDESGYITGISEGTVTITATAINGVKAECLVTVFNDVPVSDGTLYGFINFSEGLTVGLSGLVRFDHMAGTIEEILPLQNQISAAEYYNGVIYAFDGTAKVFVTFDAITNEVLSSVPVSAVAYDMTYDYTTNVMYCIYGENARDLATVNLTTGEITPVGISGDTHLMTLACDNAGQLYGVAIATGIFYEIDKNTAELTEIGDTGAGNVAYAQSMTYSEHEDVFYWAGYTTAPEVGGFLYSIDRTTGAATRVITDPIGEICGLITFNTGSIVPPETIDVIGVTVTPATIEIPWGGSAVLTYSVMPSDATNRRASWESDNTNVVIVDTKGNLKAIGSGTANVTVTTVDGGFTSTCLVTVGESPYPALAPGKAMIMLSVGAVWTDGSGYQMLLDSTHSLFGSIIPLVGPLTPGGDVSSDIYSQFDYKIPENADGVLTTQNIVGSNQFIYIIVDAGTYDFCITNPLPGGKMWIANSSNGSLGRGDNFIVEAGCLYNFTVSLEGSSDFVSMNRYYIGTTYDPGDANLDGVINTGDAAFLLRSFIGLEILSDEGRAVSDVNNDGNVNTGDAAMILEMCIN
ncbi:MAG: Ig-like domain-containing protein [Clostridia bacterium]